jgi:hypothetical protein
VCLLPVGGCSVEFVFGTFLAEEKGVRRVCVVEGRAEARLAAISKESGA